VTVEDTNVTLALQTGENAANIETLTEATETLTEAAESLENRVKWTQEDIDTLYGRIYDLESKIEAIENSQAQTANVGIGASPDGTIPDGQQAVEPATIGGEPNEAQETIIEKPEKTEDESKPKKKHFVWGLW